MRDRIVLSAVDRPVLEAAEAATTPTLVTSVPTLVTREATEAFDPVSTLDIYAFKAERFMVSPFSFSRRWP